MKHLMLFEQFILEAFDLNVMFNKQNIPTFIQEIARDYIEGEFESLDNQGRLNRLPNDINADKIIFWLAREIKRHFVQNLKEDIDVYYKQGEQDHPRAIYQIAKLAYLNGKDISKYKDKLDANVKEFDNLKFEELPSKLEQSVDYFLENKNEEMISIFDYFFSPIRNQNEKIDFVNTTLEEMYDKSVEWHENLKASGKIIDEEGTIIKELSDGYYWIDLETSECGIEADAMGHCGNTRADTLLSLRRNNESGGKSVHATMSVNYKDDGNSYSTYTQLKGKNNKKPIEKYHPYIVELLLDDRFKDFKYDSEYGAEDDFVLNDLEDKDTIVKILNHSPELIKNQNLDKDKMVYIVNNTNNERIYPYIFEHSCNNGYTDVVELLLQDKRVDPSVRNNYAIRWASKYGHTDVVELLLQDKRVDPSDGDNEAILYASEKGHTEIVRMLLKDSRVDPSDWDNSAILYASKNGHTEIVKLLLQDKRVDPSAYDNEAIRLASLKGYTEIVELLKKHVAKLEVSESISESKIKNWKEFK
jgi:ankyrin repeat protein